MAPIISRTVVPQTDQLRRLRDEWVVNREATVRTVKAFGENKRIEGETETDYRKPKKNNNKLTINGFANVLKNSLSLSINLFHTPMNYEFRHLFRITIE